MAIPRAPVGRLERVELRQAWQGEATDFTPWLAQEENIDLLSEAIGIELEVESQEKAVGPFRADILCRDTVNDLFVLIENQLERTDHPHLGQLLTYAAGLEAVTIVWIADRFTDQHRAALDWLNEMTVVDLNFFGLEVELWRIGDSALAPKFNVVSRPNDWSRAIRARADSEGATTESQQWHFDFWSEFHDYIGEQGIDLRLSRPKPRRHISASLGRSYCRLVLFNNLREHRSGIYFRLTGSESKARFQHIQSHYQEDIERSLAPHGEVRWELKPEVITSHIMVDRFQSPDDPEHRQGLMDWMARTLVVMESVFRPIVHELPVLTEEQDDPIAGDED